MLFKTRDYADEESVEEVKWGIHKRGSGGLWKRGRFKGWSVRESPSGGVDGGEKSASEVFGFPLAHLVHDYLDTLLFFW